MTAVLAAERIFFPFCIALGSVLDGLGSQQPPFSCEGQSLVSFSLGSLSTTEPASHWAGLFLNPGEVFKMHNSQHFLAPAVTEMPAAHSCIGAFLQKIGLP